MANRGAHYHIKADAGPQVQSLSVIRPSWLIYPIPYPEISSQGTKLGFPLPSLSGPYITKPFGCATLMANLPAQ